VTDPSCRRDSLPARKTGKPYPRLPVREIDLGARTVDIIVIIEVKERAALDDAVGCVTPAASRRISRAADTWMARRQRSHDFGWHYDIIAIAPGCLPSQLKDAWQPEMA
jgi:putative endonuclease